MSDLDAHFPAAPKNEGRILISTAYSGQQEYNTGHIDVEEVEEEEEEEDA